MPEMRSWNLFSCIVYNTSLFASKAQNILVQSFIAIDYYMNLFSFGLSNSSIVTNNFNSADRPINTGKGVLQPVYDFVFDSSCTTNSEKIFNINAAFVKLRLFLSELSYTAFTVAVNNCTEKHPTKTANYPTICKKINQFEWIEDFNAINARIRVIAPFHFCQKLLFTEIETQTGFRLKIVGF